MKVVRHIKEILKRTLIEILFRHMPSHYAKPDRDLNTEEGVRNFLETYEYTSRFKMFDLDSDYNKDLLGVFESNRNRFFFDYSHRDGHFRV